MIAEAEMSFRAKTAALTAKDLRIEMRGRDTLIPMLVFSITVVFLMSFALPATGRVADPVELPLGTAPLADVLAGFLWLTVLFAGLIGFARTFAAEGDDGALDALLLAPVDRSGLFLAKAVVNLLYVAATQVFLFPLAALLFGLDLGSNWLGLIAVIVLVDIGFAAIGTLFAALAANTTTRELILPVLAFPALIPIFIAALELTSALFTGGSTGDVSSSGWFGILAGYDLIFGIVAALAFDFVLD
jgi:heme exporter protein B